MDLWTDPNLWPYMAVTAHWLEAQVIRTSTGIEHRLILRSDLIGFHRIPTRHIGEHLCEAFTYILDRIGIIDKVRIFNSI